MNDARGRKFVRIQLPDSTNTVRIAPQLGPDFLLKTPFSLFLSLRYLRPKRTVVSTITVISVIGVAMGVWILTVVIAVMTGFNVEMRKNILGFEPHLTVRKEADAPIEDWGKIIQTLKAHSEVLDASPFTKTQAVMSYDSRPVVVELRGLKLEEGEIKNKYLNTIQNSNGEFDLTGDHAIVSRSMSYILGVLVEDELLFHSVRNGRELLDAHSDNREPDRTKLTKPAKMQVAGIFQSGSRESYNHAFIPLETGQRLSQLGENVSGIEVFAARPHSIRKLKAELAPLFPDYELESWQDRNKAMLDAVNLERLNMFFLLSMIVVVAGFCIMNTMITVTSQKRGEIGLMKAVGAPTSQIVGAFLGNGILVGAIGSVIGLIMAGGVLMLRRPIGNLIASSSGSEVMSYQENFLLSLPARMTILDSLVIAGGAFFACALAALLPSYFAARLDAAKALRNTSQT